MQELADQLNARCDEQPFETGWYLKYLENGKTAQRHGEMVFPSASTRKISIMMAALKAVNENRLALDQPVTIEAKYQNNKSGTFQHFQLGFTIKFRDALAMMIIVSDNTSTGTIVDMLGLDEINALHIERVLKLANGKINGPGGAAELLGIHPNTLRKRMDKLGISYKRMYF